MLEVFNLFNVTNILGTTNVNYSGFSNVLTRDSEDPVEPWLPALEPVRDARHDRRRCVRIRRPARYSTRGAGDFLSTCLGRCLARRPRGTPRRMGTWAATALVVSEVVGVGILLTPATMMRSLGGVWAPLAMWARDGGDERRRGALLRGTRDPLSASGWHLRFPARRIRATLRVRIRVDGDAGDGSRHHGGTRHRCRAVPARNSRCLDSRIRRWSPWPPLSRVACSSPGACRSAPG